MFLHFFGYGAQNNTIHLTVPKKKDIHTYNNTITVASRRQIF